MLIIIVAQLSSHSRTVILRQDKLGQFFHPSPPPRPRPHTHTAEGDRQCSNTFLLVQHVGVVLAALSGRRPSVLLNTPQHTEQPPRHMKNYLDSEKSTLENRDTQDKGHRDYIPNVVNISYTLFSS